MTFHKPENLPDVLKVLWQARLFILSGLVLGGMLAAVFVMIAVPHYKADMIIAPATPVSGSETSSLLDNDNLFALRYLVQRVGAFGAHDFLRFENTYAGTSVANVMIEDPRTRAGLARDKSFVFSAGMRLEEPEALAAYIKRRVRLHPVGSSALRRLTYTHADREFARYFLETIHRVTDQRLRRGIYEKASARTQYLERALPAINNPEHRRAMTGLLLEQERLKMLVSIEGHYTASIVEPPAAAVKPDWPQTALVMPVFVLSGALIAFLIYGIMTAWREGTGTDAADTPARHPKKWDDILKPHAGNSNTETQARRDVA